MKIRIARIQHRPEEYYKKLISLKNSIHGQDINKKTQQVENTTRVNQTLLKEISIITSSKQNKTKRKIQIECFPIIRPNEVTRHKIPIKGDIISKFVEEFKLKQQRQKKKKAIIPPVSFLIKNLK